MKKTSKTLLLVLCAVLLIVGSVAGTFAYLTDTKEVVNTFTVGDIKIKLDEATVNAETGKAIDKHGDRTPIGNEDVKLIPGRKIDKDPTVYVKEGSEAAYIRMIVTVSKYDQMKAAFDYDASYTVEASDITDMTDSNGTMVVLDKLVDRDPEFWHCVKFTEDTVANTGTYEFRYFPGVYTATDDNGNDTVDYYALEPLFTTVTVPGEIDNEHLAKLNKAEISIIAEAIQAEGFDADDAWDKFPTDGSAVNENLDAAPADPQPGEGSDGE